MHDGSNDFPYLLVDLTCGYLTSVYVPVLSGMMHALEYIIGVSCATSPTHFLSAGPRVRRAGGGCRRRGKRCVLGFFRLC